MPLDWQLIPVVVIVAAAVVYLTLTTWRSWKASKAGCGGSCGCASKSNATQANGQTPLISADQLTSRLRQRPGS